ncbi:MAG: dihydroneopterin aldolase, partial [Clostridiaceae bacterium]|nr:dihydroneopterin aldolase [Clostridiaceae bacterium]
MSNDKIVIRDLEIFAFHGVFEGEKSVGQKFLVSLELSLDLSLASRNNDLT